MSNTHGGALSWGSNLGRWDAWRAGIPSRRVAGASLYQKLQPLRRNRDLLSFEVERALEAHGKLPENQIEKPVGGFWCNAPGLQSVHSAAFIVQSLLDMPRSTCSLKQIPHWPSS